MIRERPILFSGPMVRALLDGRKTQTRRVVKLNPKWASRFPICDPSGMAAGHQVWFWDGEHERAGASLDCPYGVPGDRLWVKETWRPTKALNPWDLNVTYAADGALHTIMDGEFGERDWTMPKAAATGNVSPLFMPRWASRLTLSITDVRVQRLQDISAADSIAEGVQCATCEAMRSSACQGRGCFASIAVYRTLWNHINGKGAWAANPWVWALTFQVEERQP